MRMNVLTLWPRGRRGGYALLLSCLSVGAALAAACGATDHGASGGGTGDAQAGTGPGEHPVVTSGPTGKAAIRAVERPGSGERGAGRRRSMEVRVAMLTAASG